MWTVAVLVCKTVVHKTYSWSKVFNVADSELNLNMLISVFIVEPDFWCQTKLQPPSPLARPFPSGGNPEYHLLIRR